VSCGLADEVRPVEDVVQGLPGGAVQPAEVPGDGLQAVAFSPFAADHSFVVLVGVDGLQDAVGSAGLGDWCESAGVVTLALVLQPHLW